MDDYLFVNRALGIVSFLGFIFFCCAVAAIQGSEIKADFQDWNHQRKLKNDARRQARKGLHR